MKQGRRLRIALALAIATVCVVVVAFPASARAQTPLEVGDVAGTISIGRGTSVLRDSTGALSAGEIASLDEGRFRPADSDHPNFGFTRDVLWLRFSLHNGAESPRTYVLQATREWVDDVRLFDASGPTPVLTGRSGALIPLRARPVPTERIAFPLSLEPGETKSWLLRIAGVSPISFVADLSSQTEYAEAEARDELLFGGYYAILAALSAYSLLLFATLRDRTQLLVGILLAGEGFAEAAAHGHVSRLFPAGARWLELGGSALGFTLMIAASPQLARVALDTRRTAPNVDRVMRVGVWPITALAATVVVFPAFHAILFVGLMGMVSLSALACSARLRSPDRASWTFTLAVGAAFVPGAVTLATLFGALPAYPAVEYGNHVGTVAMSCLFALLVAHTIQTDRERVQALNSELGFQVAARSRELGQALQRAAMSFVAGRLAPGERFDERYRVVRELGSGAMGAVYEVERLTNGEHLALKVISGEVSGTQAARFAREAEIGARLRHPNLVSIVDVGAAASGAPFLVMELVNGGSMEQQRQRFGDSRWALPILRQVVSGLAELHAAGVLHRDLKPANVLLAQGDGAPIAKISDFGISRFGALVDSNDALGEADTQLDQARSPTLTQAGALLGTPLYMPPEAWHGPARHSSADLFSFGILAYEALSGRAPFAVAPILLTRAGKPIPAPPPLEGVPGGVASLVLACLSVDPLERPSAKELADGL